MARALRREEPRVARVDGTSRGPSDVELVERARGGDRWAVEAIFRRYVAAVLGLARRMLGRSDDAEDVVQETFASALTRLERLDHPERLRSWLFAIAVHRIQRRLRHRRIKAFFLGADEDVLLGIAAQTASPEVRAELALIDAILSKLPVADRIAWTLRHVEGESLVDIATMTGASLATVKRRIDAVETCVSAAIARGDRS